MLAGDMRLGCERIHVVAEWSETIVLKSRMASPFGISRANAHAIVKQVLLVPGASVAPERIPSPLKVQGVPLVVLCGWRIVARDPKVSRLRKIDNTASNWPRRLPARAPRTAHYTR